MPSKGSNYAEFGLMILSPHPIVTSCAVPVEPLCNHARQLTTYTGLCRNVL